MPFVKLDCNILNSTLWFEKQCRDLFITALLMALPYETETELEQIEIRSLEKTGWKVPAGKYGIVESAGIGIIHRALISDIESGFDALEALGRPEDASRSQDYDGRRLVRVDGGYLVLNFWKYRDKDHTAAERQRRHRARHKNKTEKKRNGVTSLRHSVTTRDVTQAEAEAEEKKRESIPRNNSIIQSETKPLAAPLGSLLNSLSPHAKQEISFVDELRRQYPGTTIDKDLKQIERWARKHQKNCTRDLVLNALKRNPPKLIGQRNGYIYKGKFIDTHTANNLALKNTEILLNAKPAVRYADGRVEHTHAK